MTVTPYRAFTIALRKFLQSRWGMWGLFFISFFESALPVPLITDPFLAVYILANQARVLSATFFCTVASVIGGVVAYAVAWYVREPLLSLFNPVFVEQFNEIFLRVQEETIAMTILGALTPIPYTAVAMAVGMSNGSLVAFTLVSVITRGARYFVVGYMTYKLGTVSDVRTRRALFALSTLAVILVVIYLVIQFI